MYDQRKIRELIIRKYVDMPLQINEMSTSMTPYPASLGGF